MTFNPSTKELQKALKCLCIQFAGWNDRIGGLTTDGLSVLEDAFDLLGWDDPHPMPELCCDEPRCMKRADYGTPLYDHDILYGYRNTCYKHRPKRDKNAFTNETT